MGSAAHVARFHDANSLVLPGVEKERDAVSKLVSKNQLCGHIVYMVMVCDG